MSGGHSPDPMAGRRAARLAAVQALYQMELGGGSVTRAKSDLRAGRLPMGEAGPLDTEPDAELFDLLVETAIEQQDGVDRTIARRLRKGWRLDRIDSVARAIMRAGGVEMWARRDTPSAVIVDEFVSIAHAFFEDGPEAGFINAARETCAKDVRGLAAFSDVADTDAGG